jgi:acyl carrier protein
MSSQQVPSSLRDILADILEISPDEVTPETGVGTIENWDSFRHLQAILAIEGEYGIQFDPVRIAELTNVSLIQAELEAKGVTLER